MVEKKEEAIYLMLDMWRVCRRELSRMSNAPQGQVRCSFGLNCERVCLFLPEAGNSMETVSANISANELRCERK